MLDQRGRLLMAALGFAGVLHALDAWRCNMRLGTVAVVVALALGIAAALEARALGLTEVGDTPHRGH
jgi:hypothetical protein